MRIAPLGFALAIATALVVNGAFADEKAPGDTGHGKAVFAENCSVCHGTKGEGGMGPALKDELKRKTAAQIRAQIIDPAPPMAKLYPSVLSQKDVDDVVAYVVTL